MSFHYNADEEKNGFPARATVCMEFAHSPHVCGDFFWGLWFLPTSQRCASRWMVWLHCPRLSECGWVRVFLRWKGIRPGWVPPWALSCSERFQPPWPWTGIRWKIMISFLSVFSKCMYSSHLFHCLTFRSALGLYLEVRSCSRDQKYAVDTCLLSVYSKICFLIQCFA